MEMFNAILSRSYALNERIACEIFEVLPECAPLVAIIDRQGHRWFNDEEAFAGLNLSDDLLGDLRAKVDDGAEPAAIQVGDAGVAMVQLATEHTNCGYLLLASPRCGLEATPAGLDLTGTLVSLVGLVAQLLEKDRMLSEFQMKCFSAYHTADAPAN